MSSGGTIWWKVCEIDFVTVYDWIIGLEAKRNEEWWMMERKEWEKNTSVAIVMSKTMIQRGLEQVLNES